MLLDYFLILFFNYSYVHLNFNLKDFFKKESYD